MTKTKVAPFYLGHGVVRNSSLKVSAATKPNPFYPPRLSSPP